MSNEIDITRQEIFAGIIVPPEAKRYRLWRRQWATDGWFVGPWIDKQCTWENVLISLGSNDSHVPKCTESIPVRVVTEFPSTPILVSS